MAMKVIDKILEKSIRNKNECKIAYLIKTTLIKNRSQFNKYRFQDLERRHRVCRERKREN